MRGGARYADFFRYLQQLDRIDWEAVNASDFRERSIKDKKQAEFLLHDTFPVDLIEVIGVNNPSVAESVNEIIRATGLTINIEVRPDWYFA